MDRDAEVRPKAARWGRFERCSRWFFSALGSAFVAVLVWQFFKSVDRSREQALRSSLRSIRIAVYEYRKERGGRYPAGLSELAGKYIDKVPEARAAPCHGPSAAVRLGREPDDSGGWLYNGRAADDEPQAVWINCTHTDWKGTVWAAY